MNLLTERLILSPVTAADAVVLHRLWTSPGGRKYLWDDEIISLSQTEEITNLSQRYFAEQGTGLWLVSKREPNDTPGEAVGYAGLWYFRTPPELELLYGMDEALWRRGFAAEAARAVMAYGFEKLGLNQIVASTDAPNAASIRVMEKLDMAFQRCEMLDGKDTVFYVCQRRASAREEMRKYELALMLAQRFGYTSYLEICTPTTGNTYSQVDKEQFSRRVRLMYRCPSDFVDGEPIDLRTPDESCEALFHTLISRGEKFDLVFVDPFHTYETSLRDIVWGLQLTKPGGVVLIHDCNPPNAEVAAPNFQSGEWCGVTYAAYLDVVLHSEYRYLTIDTDYGCGVIGKREPLAALFGAENCMVDRQIAALAEQWRLLPLAERYPFFDKHRAALLKLIATAEFCARVGAMPHTRQC